MADGPTNGLTLETGFTGNKENKAGYTANPVPYGWAGAVYEITRSRVFGQGQ